MIRQLWEYLSSGGSSSLITLNLAETVEAAHGYVAERNPELIGELREATRGSKHPCELADFLDKHYPIDGGWGKESPDAHTLIHNLMKREEANQ